MKSHTYHIVGSHFRPPAKGLLQSFRSEQKLWLRPEPDNPYDPNAIAVWVLTQDIPGDAAMCEMLDANCGGMGHDNESIRQESEFHLGYIPKEIALVLSTGSFQWPKNGLSGSLGFSVEPKRPYTITFHTES